MSTGALLLMSAVWITVISVTGYFFYRILTAPKHQEPDSFSAHDDKV
jgi:hypothetical protein